MVGDIVARLALVFEAAGTSLLLDEVCIFKANESARELELVESGEGASSLRGLVGCALGVNLCLVCLNLPGDSVPPERVAASRDIVQFARISADGVFAATLHVGELVGWAETVAGRSPFAVESRSGILGTDIAEMGGLEAI